MLIRSHFASNKLLSRLIIVSMALLLYCSSAVSANLRVADNSVTQENKATFLDPILLLTLFSKTNMPPENLLSNSGFEPVYHIQSDCDGTDPAQGNITGFIAEEWQDNSCWNQSSTVVYSQDTLEPHGGTSAQKVTVLNGLGQIGQILPLKIGYLYQARIWLRADSEMAVTLLIRQVEDPYTYYAQKKVTLFSQWQEYNLEGIAVSSQGYFMILAEQPGSFYLDDAQLHGHAISPSPLPANPIPKQFFGMHYHSEALPWVPEGLGVGTVRLWDAVQWAEINTAPGVYDWTALDLHVERALQNGADIVFNLARTPHWASARPFEYTPYADINGGPEQNSELQGQAAEPADLQYWRDWVSAVGNRYKGKISYWEIWNEPNFHWFWTGTTEQLIELSREAYTILKTIDPGNQIISPSPYDAGYLDEYLQLGGGQYADIIGYHFYLNTKKPEYLYEGYVPAIKLIMKHNNQELKPLWDTENGWPGNAEISEYDAVGLLTRAYLLERAAGVSRFYFYAWDEQIPVILALPPEYTALNPVGEAYAQLSNWLTGARMLEIDQDNAGVWIIKIMEASGNLAYILWNPEQIVNFNLPQNWSIATLHDLSGNSSNIEGTTQVSVGPHPVLLK